MTYYQLLQKYIEESGLSHRAIARKTEELGKKVSQGYISQLVRGSAPAPSPEISELLAKVTGGDANKLIELGEYEKTPERIRNKATAYDKLIEYLVSKKPIQVTDQDNTKNTDSENYYNSEEFLASLNNDMRKEFISDILSDMAHKSPSDFTYVLNSVMGDDEIKEEKTAYSIQVPIYNEISVGKRKASGEFTTVDSAVLKGSSAFAIKAKDDSMAADRIKNGDVVIIAEQNDVQGHEIAAVVIDEQPAVLRRVKSVGDMCMLIPSNPSFEPELKPCTDVKILGKVIEVKFIFE